MEPQEKPKFSWIRLAVISAIVILTTLAVGGTTWYVMDQNAERERGELEKQIQELEDQKAIESTDTESVKEEKNTEVKDSDSATRNGVTMEISPTSGPVNTKVQVEITGLDNYDYTDLFFRSAGGWVPSVHQKITNENSKYSGTYIIPSTVLTSAASNAQNPTKLTPTDKGEGEIVLTSGTSPSQEITIPFTLK